METRLAEMVDGQISLHVDNRLITATVMFENATMRVSRFEDRLFIENKILRELLEVFPDFECGLKFEVQAKL
jgi:hypothetical protein